MLDNIDDLVTVLNTNWRILGGTQVANDGSLYCPACGEERRMAIYVPFVPREVLKALQGGYPGRQESKDLVPSLLGLQCLQCQMTFTGVIYPGPDGPDVVILPSRRGGLTTPHTPEGVSYYLDQAHRAEVLAARSAAVAMYRGALEHLLFEQGYTTGMLGRKLELLETDIKNSKAPKWSVDLDTEFLGVLKDLGNGSIHPNDGDVTKQSALDGELLRKVRETFLMLLFLVYEAPHKKQEHLNALKAKAQILKK
jgi:hypothetical protein